MGKEWSKFYSKKTKKQNRETVEIQSHSTKLFE